MCIKINLIVHFLFMFSFTDVKRITILPREWEIIIGKINGQDSKLKTLIADDIVELKNISVEEICSALLKLKYSHIRKMNVCTDRRRRKINKFFTMRNKQRLSKFSVFRHEIYFDIFGPC